MKEELKRAYDQQQCGQAVNEKAQPTCNMTYRPSCREEAEMRIGQLRSEADKADRAVAFFRDHPEFDEFIQLIRQGVIGI